MKVHLSYTIFILLSVGTQAKQGRPSDFLATLHLTDEHLQDAFVGLDPLYTKKIDQHDLKRLYYYGNSEFARKKFTELLDKDAKDLIRQPEVGECLRKQAVTNAVWECTYIKSKSLREFCFADQILTYAYLVLNKNAVEMFFKSIQDPKSEDELITLEDVKKLITLNEMFTEKDALNFMREVGGDDQIITIDDFKEYVSQEDILDNFRVCRTKMVDHIEEYDNDCLQERLIDWTMYHLTELDIITVFEKFEDDSDDDLDVTDQDLIKTTGCNDDVAKKFVKLMDKSNDGRVCYAEFRTYVKSPLVKLHLEGECAFKAMNQVEEVECFKRQLMNRVEEFHTPIWLPLPGLDMLFTFEELDTSNNGRISVEDDLVKGLKWPRDVATKMVKEMDGPDSDENISLDEFNEYIGWPNIIYGIADCQGFRREIFRIKCYTKELKKNINLMLDKIRVTEFYKFYDKDGNGRISRMEVEVVGVTGNDLQMFVDELGMGDDTITYDEFKWYVRQEELSKMFEGFINSPDLHKRLLDFVTHAFTEYDTQNLFQALDVNGDDELDRNEFGVDSIALHHLIQRMDVLAEKDVSANFVEFWLYWNTPIGNPRKQHLEEECTKNQMKETKGIECFKTTIKRVIK